MLEDKLKALPSSPGVYLMKNEDGRIIYVGKAISLKNRVRSYFKKGRHDSAKTRALVKNIKDLDYILTDSEIEALILENNLIKKHRPKYNISLKDDKTYPYIKITNEDFPRVLVTRRKKKDKARYFGPYTSAGNLRETLEILQKTFPYRTCRQKNFTNSRPCLNYHIKRCLAPCVGKISKLEYNEIIESVIFFLEGKQASLLKDLEKRMYAAAENLEFERAGHLRDQIKVLESIMAKQKIIVEEDIDQDIIAMARGLVEVCVEIFFVRSGKVIGRDSIFLKGADDETRQEILESFVKQYYNEKDFIPKEILLEQEISDLEIVEEWLSKKRGNRVYIKTPQRGAKKELLDLVGKNALEIVQQREVEIQHKKSRDEDALYELEEVLDLEKTPERIECYDISNTQGQESVASMVVFVNGRPEKKEYRKFKIRSVEGPDDYKSMEEVLTRRFQNAKKQAGNFSKLPDMVLIDGGRGQLAVALRVLDELGFAQIPVFSLAEKEELIFLPHERQGLYLERDSKALHLLQRLRDEAHRFALNYHRSLRGKKSIASILEDIPQVGEVRRKNLLRHFGSLKRIQEASRKELLEVDGITESVADSIELFFKTNQDLVLRLKD